MGDIFKYIQAFGNVIGDIEQLIIATGPVTLEEIHTIVDDVLNDMGLLIPKDSALFAALVGVVDAIVKAIIEGQKLAPTAPPTQLK